MIDRKDKFYEAAIDFVSKYEVTVSDHIIDIVVSVMRTRDNVPPMGDQDCLKNIRIIVAAKRHCHLKSL